MQPAPRERRCLRRLAHRLTGCAARRPRLTESSNCTRETWTAGRRPNRVRCRSQRRHARLRSDPDPGGAPQKPGSTRRIRANGPIIDDHVHCIVVSRNCRRTSADRPVAGRSTREPAGTTHCSPPAVAPARGTRRGSGRSRARARSPFAYLDAGTLLSPLVQCTALQGMRRKHHERPWWLAAV